MTDIEQITIVDRWWSLAPLGKPYLDYLNPHTWPDAWTLLDSKDFDPATISLGIFYTLMMSGDGRWQHDQLELAVARSQRLSHENLCCIIRHEIVVGFMHNAVDNLDEIDDMRLLHRYNYDATRRRIMEIKTADFVI